jgi:hypothetical protein
MVAPKLSDEPARRKTTMLNFTVCQYWVSIFAAFLLGFVSWLCFRCDPGQEDSTNRPSLGEKSPIPDRPDQLIDVLKHLSRTNRALHEERIKRELQVVIVTVGLYAATVAFKYTKDFPSANTITAAVISTAFLLLAILTGWYLYGSKKGNDINQTQAEQAEHLLREMLTKTDIKNFLPPTEHPNKNRWSWEVAVVLISALISGYLISCT